MRRECNPKAGLGSSYLTFKTFQGPAHAHLFLSLSYELIVKLLFITMQTPSYGSLRSFTAHFLSLKIDDFTFQDIKVTDGKATYRGGDGITQLVQLQKKENIIEKSLDKLKEASTV